MKKRSGVRRAVPILASSSLEAMSTKELLARLARLRFCEDQQESSDLTTSEIAATEGIFFKDSAAWRAAYADIKLLLARREHVPRPAARKALPNGRSQAHSPHPRRAVQRGRATGR